MAKSNFLTRTSAAVLAALTLSLPLASSCSRGGGSGESSGDVTDLVLGTDVNENGVIYNTSEEKGYLNKISELNTAEGTPDSHAGETATSFLMLNNRETWKPKVGNIGTPYYPRVKKLANGKYLMTFNDGPQGPDVYYRIGDSLSNWSSPAILFKEEPGVHEGHTRRYAAADSVVLQDGTILVAATYWEGGCYSTDFGNSGTVMKKSTDNGKTWSEAKVIYKGISWEPCLVQLKSGEIQCYLTHIAPYCVWYGYHPSLRSSGSAIIRSFDGGETWTPNVTDPPYEADRVMQTYIGMRDGKKIFNDQMPVAVELNNGDIACVCESIDLSGNYRTMLGVTHDNWAKPLGATEAGPEDKFCFESTINCYGPYIRQMLSGETVVSMSASGMELFMGDETAHNFRNIGQVNFDGLQTGGWDSLEVLNPHALLAVSTYRSGSDKTQYAVLLNTYYLNHRINATKSAVKVDGTSGDWKDNTDALFVGSRTQAQASLRVGHDDDNLYFLVERLDDYLSESGDTMTLFFSADAGTTIYRLTIDPIGKVTLEKKVGDGYEAVSGEIQSAITLFGNFENRGKDDGYLAEIAVPKSLITSDGSGKLRLNAELSNVDKGETALKEKVFPEDRGDLSKAGTVVLD